MRFNRRRNARFFKAVVPGLIAALVLTGCGTSGIGGDSSGSSTNSRKPKEEQPGKFAEGSAMKQIQDKGKLVVGLPTNKEPFASENPTTGSLEGFDIEIARLMASGIFGAKLEGRIEFIPLDERDRELALAQNKVDIALGRYGINVQRKRFVDFAGPYFTSYQTVAAGNRIEDSNGRRISFDTLADLNGQKICVVRGSTNVEAIKAAIPQGNFDTVMNTVQECAAEVTTKRVVAVAAENVDMQPILSRGSGYDVITQNKLGVDQYGIGVSKQKIDLRRFLNDRLGTIEADKRWEAAYKATMPDMGDEPPPIDRY